MRLLILIPAVLLAWPASAQSLRERQAMAAAEEALSADMASLNAACGTEMTARIDWSGFTSEDFASNNSISGWCSHAISGMRSLCTSTIDGGLGRQAVQERISALTCARDAQRAMSLSEDGTLTYTVNFESSNNSVWTADWLRDNL